MVYFRLQLSHRIQAGFIVHHTNNRCRLQLTYMSDTIGLARKTPPCGYWINPVSSWGRVTECCSECQYIYCRSLAVGVWLWLRVQCLGTVTHRVSLSKTQSPDHWTVQHYMGMASSSKEDLTSTNIFCSTSDQSLLPGVHTELSN